MNRIDDRPLNEVWFYVTIKKTKAEYKEDVSEFLRNSIDSEIIDSILDIVRNDWCKNQDSSGKFYYGNKFWAFELERDAFDFVMRWA
jgi:hypothetical protein